MTTVLAGANLDQFRPRKAQEADLAVLRSTADAVAVVEWSHLSQQRFWPALPVLASRFMRSALRRRGYRIRTRYFRAVLLHPDDGLQPFWYVVAHMPPKRMWGPLYAAYARRLRRFVRSLPGEKAVYADWNRLVRRDPCRLRKTFGGALYGTRIDGFWISTRLALHVTDYREVPQPERTDKHPFCYLTLKETP